MRIPPRFRELLAKIKERAIVKYKIHCSEHPDKVGEYYCQQHNEIACGSCAFNKHADHKNQVREASK